MGNPTIREAKPSDRDQLAEMRLLLQHHVEASNPRIWYMTKQGKQEIGQDINQMLSDEDGRVIVAKEDGSIIGYAYGHVSHRTTFIPKSVGFIHGIYVREPHRRRRPRIK